MSKRGQITIFLVIGILILFLAAGIFFTISKIKKAPLEVQQAEVLLFEWVRPSVITYVERCLKETTASGVYLLAANGGIIYPDDTSVILLTDTGLVNYGWLNGVSGFSDIKMEQDLGQFITKYLEQCLGDFEIFEDQGIDIQPDFSRMKAAPTIGKTSIQSDMTLPISISLPTGDIITLDSFTARVDSNLGDMVNVAEEVVEQAKDTIDFLEFQNLPYYPVIFPYDESVTLYSLTDEKGAEDTPSLLFLFAVGNDDRANRKPTLQFIPDVTLRVGDRWEFILITEDHDNDDLIFQSSSAFFPVTEDGLLNVTVTQVGAYSVLFSVKDEQGAKDQQEVTITVLEK